MKTQTIPTNLSGTVRLNIVEGLDDPTTNFDFLFDTLSGKTVEIVVDGFSLTFEIDGVSLTQGRKVTVR